MQSSRRQVLVGGGAVALAAALGSALFKRPDKALLPDGTDALFLHSGGQDAVFALRLREAAAPGRIVARRIAPLTHAGFAEAGRLLDDARGRHLVALLDDADALVIESLLKARGARGLTIGRRGTQALVTGAL